MGDKEPRDAVPIKMIVERRRQRTAELSSSEVMRILRKRAAKTAKKDGEDPDSVP